jgi:hypothetical protein
VQFFLAVIGLSFVFDFLGDSVLPENFLAQVPVALLFAHLFLEGHQVVERHLAYAALLLQVRRPELAWPGIF